MQTQTEHAGTQAAVRGKDDGDAVWFRNNRMTIKLRAVDTAGAFGLAEAWAPAGSGPPLHVHHREDELFWILSGHLTIRCGDREFSAGPGACALLPRDVPHTFRVAGDEPAHLLILISPGGGEEFFAAAGDPAGGPGLPPAAPPDMAAAVAVAAQFGMDILGPPMGPTDDDQRQDGHR
jgi:mannose-6-phosphate isomerase-like protein (cupin superfamily)